MRKIALTTIVLLTIVIIIFAVFWKEEQENFRQLNPLSAVPTNTELFFQVNDVHQFFDDYNENKQIWNDIKKIKSLSNFNNTLIFLDSILKTDVNARKISSSINRLTIALALKGRDKVEILFIVPLKSRIAKQRIENIIEKQKNGQYTSDTKMFSKESLITIKDKTTNKAVVSYYFTNNFFLISPSSLLLEDAILQLSTKKSEILSDEEYIKLSKTEGKGNVFNFYINHKRISQILSLFVNENLSQFIKNFNDYSTWSEVDLEILDQQLMLTGFTILKNDNQYFTNVFSHQEPVRFDMEQVLPSSCISYGALLMSDAENFNNDYKIYLESTGEIHQYNKKLYDWKKTTGINSEQFFYNLFDKEMAAVFLDKYKDDEKNNSFFVMKIKSRTKAKKDLENLITQLAEKHNTTKADYIQNQNIDEGTIYTIYQIPFKNFAYQLWGRMFKNIPTNYVVLLGNYLIAGNSPEAIKNYVYENILNKTLIYDDAYNLQKNKFPQKGMNFRLYVNNNEGYQWMRSFFNKKIQSGLDLDKEIIKRFQYLGYQFSVEDNYLYNNLFITYNPEVKEKPQTIWQSRLDNDFSMKPALVINHNTHEREIMIQDNKNKLYLISGSGRIIWKNKLNEQINSLIYQVDYYKNNKLQYLFSTESQLHLIDRNGNYVERYPINLKSTSSAGLALFDYEKNKNYRIFIPCNDKNIYAYDMSGNIINGWEFDGADYVVESQVQHFNINGKDYIVFGDKSRCYILNRRGKERVKANMQYGKSKNNAFYFDANQKCYVTTNPEGLILNIYFDGNVKTMNIGKYSENHFFNNIDLDNDKKPDFIIADKKKLNIYNSRGKQLFTKEFKNNIPYTPNIYAFSSNIFKIGVTDGNKIYLYKANGNLHPGFPLQGKTPFTIGFLSTKNRRFNLFVSGENTLLYNYIVK